LGKTDLDTTDLKPCSTCSLVFEPQENFQTKGPKGKKKTVGENHLSFANLPPRGAEEQAREESNHAQAAIDQSLVATSVKAVVIAEPTST